MIHQEGTATSVSIITVVTSFMTGAIPVLQFLALAVSIISGILAVIAWIRRFRKES